MSKTNENDLNSLLEDALTDLIDGGNQDQGDSSLAQRGPDIAESLKKISEVTSEDCPSEKASGSGSKGENNNCKKSSKNRFGGSNNVADMVDEEEMNKFFANMTEQLKAELPKIDPEDAQAKINESFPQIIDLMQNLLSKELLYPALKDLSPKFDQWLERKDKDLTKGEKKRYKKQKDIINEIIATFDDENVDDQDKFVKNLELMEQMQSLGAPPEELTVPGQPKCPIM